MGWARRFLDAYGIEDAKSYGRTPWLLTLGTLILGTGRGIVAPFLVLFLVRERGLDLGFVGVGITVEFLVRAAMGPVAGAISDRYGRKPLMLIGLASTALILPAYLLVRGPMDFMLISVANGLFAAHSLYGPAASAMVMDVTPPERRGGVFGLIHASRNLGWTIGITLGAALTSIGLFIVFVVGGLLPLAYFFVTLAILREPPRQAANALTARDMVRGWGEILRRPVFALYAVLSVTLYLGWGQVNTIFPLFVAEGLGLGDAAIALLALNTILIVLLQIPFGRLADRVARPRMLAGASLALALTYVAYAAATLVAGATPGFALVLAGILAFTMAELLYTPVVSSYAAELAPPGRTGSALGLMQFAAAVGQGLPPLLADGLAPTFGWAGVWLALATLAIPSAVGFALLARATKRPPAASATTS